MNKLSGDFYCVGLSHKSAQTSMREPFHLSKQNAGAFVHEAKKYFHEVMVVSTCNRSEVYAFSQEKAYSVEQAKDICLDVFNFIINSEKQIFAKKKYFYAYKDEEALTHIFQVAASLDSMVIGEPQITGQFKQAFLHARDLGSIGKVLTRLCQSVLACSKKIRTHTHIGKTTVSIAHTSLMLAKRIFKDFENKQFLFIGAGEMISTAARHAVRMGAKHIKIANRTLEKAEQITLDIGVGESYDLDALTYLLQEAHIVISSTGSHSYMIHVESLKTARHSHKQRHSLVIIDLAVPRDIDPECAHLDEVYLFELDDLKKITESNSELRHSAVAEANVMIQKHITVFLDWFFATKKDPILDDIKNYIDTLFVKEYTKTFSKALLQDVSPAHKIAVRKMLDSLSSKILQDVAKTLKKPSCALLEACFEHVQSVKSCDQNSAFNKRLA
jgi:glutamyl-tRNA reductase